MKIVYTIMLLFLSVLLVACGDEWLEEDVTKGGEKTESQSSKEGASYVDESVELVDLLIDGGCKEGEVFNEDDESCSLVIDCNSPEDCARWGDDLVVQLEETYGSLVLEETVATDYEGLDVLTKYDVDLDNEVLVTEDNITDETLEYHSSLWYGYAWLIPEYAREDMNKFEVFDSGDTLAHVYLHDEFGTEDWTLGMNRENLELASETMITYIHEFSHLLSLRDTEVDYYADANSCEHYYLDDTCYYEDAYIAYFYEQFYSNGLPEATLENYISDYAMTSIVEDFAESFAHFVLSPQPTGDTIVEQKILYFYQFEDLIQLRADILARAATWMDRTVEA